LVGTGRPQVRSLYQNSATPWTIPTRRHGLPRSSLTSTAPSRAKRCVLLYCGDLDPGGLHISGKICSNLNDMSQAVGWWPNNLIIDRFGIDAAFIRRHRMTWIENLHTSKKGGLPLDDPEHKDHWKRYVQEYLAAYGARKVEATALVKPHIVPHARALCLKTILKYLPESAPEEYESSLELPRTKMAAEIKRLLKVE
jgi:hypothetical protein